jgi:hypothetical protein
LAAIRTPTHASSPLFNSQRTTELAGQRRTCPSSLLDMLPPLTKGLEPEKKEPSIRCFDRIAAAIKQGDKPLVQIEDDGNGAAVRYLAHANPDTPPAGPRDINFVTKSARGRKWAKINSRGLPDA